MFLKCYVIGCNLFFLLYKSLETIDVFCYDTLSIFRGQTKLWHTDKNDDDNI